MTEMGTGARTTPPWRSAVAWLGAVGLASALGLSACENAGSGRPVPASAVPASGQTASTAITGSSDAGLPAGTFGIAFLGDSLTAGLGVLTDEAYPADLSRLFAADGYSQVDVINAGVSGDTTAGGLRRLNDILAPGVRIVVVALGGNDALRGLSPAQTHDNLAAIIRAAQAKSVQVVLVGMLAPPNLGPDYRDAFAKTFVDLAHEYSKSVVYVPFLLEGVAGIPTLNQADGIHPTAEGAKIIADHLYPVLRNLVDTMQ
jgi:acyl-CoA thioesterase-1